MKSAAPTTTRVRRRLPTHRPPTHPGEMLLEEFLKPLGITQMEAAARMGVPFQRMNTLVKGKRGVTADTALRLAKALSTSAELWLNLQNGFDLQTARRQISKDLAKIGRVSAAADG